jgi:hypothetical protein
MITANGKFFLAPVIIQYGGRVSLFFKSIPREKGIVATEVEDTE